MQRWFVLVSMPRSAPGSCMLIHCPALPLHLRCHAHPFAGCRWYICIMKMPLRLPVHFFFFVQVTGKFAFAGTEWKNNIPATSVFLYRHGTGFQTYRQDILYRQAIPKKLFAGTKWKIIYRQPKCFGTGTEPDFKYTGMKFCTGNLFKKIYLPVQYEK